MPILRVKKIISLLSGFFIFSLFLLLPAQAQEKASYGLDESAAKVGAFKAQIIGYDTDFFNTKIGQIVGFALSFIGVVFLILMIYAGISWMTAAGNQEKVSKAKDLIINAIIGLIIVLMAYAITSFIGDSLIK